MQVKLNFQVFLFIFIYFFTHQIEEYVVTLCFAIIHELGHILAGIMLGLKPKELKIMPFGVNILFEDYRYKKNIEKKKVLISLAGPVTNCIIGLIVFFLNINIGLKELIVYTNFLIMVFNLIPIYPLDGGRILKYLLMIKNSKEKSEYIINKISNFTIILLTALASILILYLKNIAILFIIIYLWIIIIRENKKYNLKAKVYKILQTNNKNIDI